MNIFLSDWIPIDEFGFSFQRFANNDRRFTLRHTDGFHKTMWDCYVNHSFLFDFLIHDAKFATKRADQLLNEKYGRFLLPSKRSIVLL